MIHRIEIFTDSAHADPAGEAILARLRRWSGIGVERVRTAAIYLFADEALDGGGLPVTLQQLGEELFADPILHRCTTAGEALQCVPFDWYVEVGFRPGVTDNVGRTAQESLQYRLGRPLAEGQHVHSASGYFLSGGLDAASVQALARDWLSNDLIQSAVLVRREDWQQDSANLRKKLFNLPAVTLTAPVAVERIALDDLDALNALSSERLLALDARELAAIQEHYRKPEVTAARRAAGLDERATDVELEVIAQTWSEHCKHKIFNADIVYRDEQGQVETIHSLYKTWIQGATRQVRAALGADDWCLSVFTDNAGVVRFDDDWSLVYKVETHNSPSALDPYGGALTGIVGVNRDPFGTGRGAELLFNTDVFCFASPYHDKPLPPGLLHPRRIYEGVRLGVEHGGNKSGVPTINGSVTFHERYLGKPLVFCGTGGLLPAVIGERPGHEKWVDPGDRIVMVGGRIGKDGIHGATFSSMELSASSPATAVQIGDPIVQKKMFDFLLLARDQGLFNAITDNGAGGLSSSVGEMATLSGGATLHLDWAPLKYPGLQPWEIFVSEAQERMTLAVPPGKLEALQSLAASMDVEATDLGEFNASGVLQARYGDDVVALLDMEFLHEGLPTLQLRAQWRPPAPQPPPAPSQSTDHGAALLALLGRLNICSKESMVRQYDHEVQGASVIKPMVGVHNDGPGDAAVLRPVLNSTRGIAVAHGICARYSDLDTYAMAACAVDEAVRSVVAVGADPERIAGLDNFCWCDPLPSPTNPDAEYKLAQLVRAVRAVYDVTVAYGVPLISGKDSMKNDYVHGETRISIPPTLLFSAVGIVNDVRRAVTMDAKAPGDGVYLLGDTREELGGSEYYAHLGAAGGAVPQVQSERAKTLYGALSRAIATGWVRSAHDCSDGGLAVALAESAFAGGWGFDLELAALPESGTLTAEALLFSETPSRLVVTVAPGHRAEFERTLAGQPCHRLGTVTEDPRMILRGGAGNQPWVDLSLAALKEAWQAPLRDF